MPGSGRRQRIAEVGVTTVMAQQVLEGTWEEIQNHAADLTGRRVRVEVLNGDAEPVSPARSTTDEWLDAFRSWVASHSDITAVVLDDSREAIYAEDEDRG
jgi:hypothetical protein